MIYVNMGGRCGNQLFRYAFAYSLSRHYNEEIICNYFSIYNNPDKSFVDNLSEFAVDDFTRISEKKDLVLTFGNIAQKIIYIVYRLVFNGLRFRKQKRYIFLKDQSRWQSILNRFGIYNLIQGDAELKYSSFKNKFILGNYENKKYFDNIRGEIRRQFVPKKTNDKNKELLNTIINSESVCISIRRGDFLSSKYERTRNVCNEQYYLSAIKIMNERVKNAVFIFFSDDIEWAKKNIHISNTCYYETGEDSVSEKLRLMSHCKHFIISNSTFSWWAQYLSDNRNKTVISPNVWLDYEKFKHPLIDDKWILVDVKSDYAEILKH